MTLLEALILGIVEGITEFLPVSSTAHMILTAELLRLPDSAFVKSFEIIVQLGAILAVVLLYWRKLLDVPLLMKAAVGFIPTGIVGLTVYKAVKAYLLGNVPVVLGALLLGGVVLIWFDRRWRDEPDAEVDFSAITYRDAALIGLFQCLAMIPGVSRSAASIIGGTLIGIPKRTIVEFSFILAIPTMAAATGYDLLKSHGELGANLPALGVGFVVSFITALLAVKTFLAFLRGRAFATFGWYRILVALIFPFVVGR
ncbi:undecaprenyl-diphosphatase UppP [Roseisolibacter sp. H3M3-2]|uniref:undecaprenyl-diphosphatase UppP n=1 Tax=Roseisolibacter sp. H3M3-2 TaxID=3031323 RepID=UPI0023DB2F3E|nr:undecaprenyl-diphosphatase UppP [Roseisolibacter sp. H3M3-2]MDF1504949.1 undecaprenyl-diphosphatase UppP [Roseisolibacter sp. H3M3-2]